MRKYLMAGLLIWVPLVITLWVLQLIIGSLDRFLLLLPTQYQPVHWLGFSIPGLGALLVLVIVIGTGVIAANFFGKRLVTFWEELLARIPFFKSIYFSVKQVSDTLLAPNGQAFRKAVLVQYPRAGSWTIGFLTGQPGGDVVRHLQGDYISVYVPTTPNPTSGFFLMMPRSEAQELDMSVDEALKYVISMGVVAPASRGL